MLSFNDFEIDSSNENSIKNDSLKILKHVKPDWDQNSIKFKVYTDGATNSLIGAWNDEFDNQVLIKVYGKNTEKFIDREMEIQILKLINEHDLGSEVFASFKNGLIYGFCAGVVLTTDSVRQDKIIDGVTRTFSAMHKIKVDHEAPILFKKFREFLSLIPEDLPEDIKRKFSAVGMNTECLKVEMDALEPIIVSLSCPVVFCHNDLNIHNAIWNESSNSIRFIDYEFAGLNYQAFDVANHFDEFVGLHSFPLDYDNLYPDEDFQRHWLRSYLAAFLGIDAENVDKGTLDTWVRWVAKFALASHLLWATCAVLQACNSKLDFDFAGYAIERLSQYFKKKEDYISM